MDPLAQSARPLLLGRLIQDIVVYVPFALQFVDQVDGDARTIPSGDDRVHRRPSGSPR